MKDLNINRRQVLKVVGAAGVVGALGGPTAVFAANEGDGRKVRWDIVSIDFGVGAINPGGHASAIAQDGSTITLTGSGTFRLGDVKRVTGGGTWTATGSVSGSGTYEVTELVSFVTAPSGPVPITDNIGEAEDSSSGLAFLRIAYSNGQHGVLAVSCALPGTPPAPASIFEGIRTSMGYVDFWNGTAPVGGVNGNRTIFHIGD